MGIDNSHYNVFGQRGVLLLQDVQPEFPIWQIYFALQFAQYPEIHLFVETEI